MSIAAISNMSHLNQVNAATQPNIDKLAAAYPSNPQGASSSALQGSLGAHEMIQGNLQEMMREVTPHLGQNLDIEA